MNTLIELIKLKFRHAKLRTYWFLTAEIQPDEKVQRRRFKKTFGRELNLDNPTTLNEKLQWLMLYDRKDFYTTCVDKFGIREYIAKEFGQEYLIPLLFKTDSYRDIRPENIPDCNCILKATHDSGHYQIIRDKSKINYTILREKCRFWLSMNYYKISKEWPYNGVKPQLVIEKLLETKSGKIPNDYKLHYINGKLEFVYVSYDREGSNDRCVYDRNWNKLPFVWIEKKNYRPEMNSTDVPKPETFDKMVEFGDRIAQNFKYVRVDYYDVDGKLYFGEITLYHGTGLDHFIPEKYDLIYGNKLKL